MCMVKIIVGASCVLNQDIISINLCFNISIYLGFSVQKIRVFRLRVMHFFTTGVHKSVTSGYNKDIDNFQMDSIRLQLLYCHNNSEKFKDILHYTCKKTG